MDPITLILFVVVFAIAYFTRPKPQVTNAKPATLGQFQLPTATEGRPVPLIWGTVKISGPNVTWYGDLKKKPLTQTQSGGLFSGDVTSIVGYQYYIGIMFAFCRGVTGKLLRIWANDQLAWNGEVGQDGIAHIDAVHLFGGITAGGGLKGDFHFYTGAADQLPNVYMTSTSADALINDDFTKAANDITAGIPFATFNGGEYSVSRCGSNFGPNASDTTNITRMCTLNHLSTDPSPNPYALVHLRSNVKSDGFSAGDSNNYCAVDTSASRPRMIDNIKIEMQASSYQLDGVGGANTPHLMFMGCRVMDTGSLDSDNGIFVVVNSSEKIKVIINSPTTGGNTTLVTLNAPGDFPSMSNSLLHKIRLHVEGSKMTLFIDGLVRWTGTDARILDIDTSFNQGFCIGVNGNLNFDGTGVNYYASAGIYAFTVDSLIRNIVSDFPAYRGTSYGVYEQGYVGTQTSIAPWAFELQRIPNGLALGSGHEIVNLFDSNPANVIYEILTDPDWGLGFSSGDIDLTAFGDAAEVLFTEGNGFSFLLDQAVEADDLLKQLEQQVGGIVFIDRSTGLFTLKLVRGDYTLGDMPAVDESNIIEVKDFTRGSWYNTTNNIHIQYTSRSKDYATTYSLAQDMANIAMQGNTVVSVTDQYPGVTDDTLASQIAWRVLRTMSYPLAKAQFVCNRTLSSTNPGDVLRWSDTKLGITDMPMRVTRVDLGKLEDGQVTIDAVQDVFTFATPSMANAPASFWVDPSTNPVDVSSADRVIFVAPKAFCDRAIRLPGTYDRLWIGARQPGDRSFRYEVWVDSGPDYSTTSTDYVQDSIIGTFMVEGKLAANITNVSSGSISVTASPDTQTAILNALGDRSARDIGVNLQNIALVDNEFIGFTTIGVTNDAVVLSGIYRGLMDTVPVSHAANASFSFLSGNISNNRYSIGDVLETQLLADGPDGTLNLGSSTVTTTTMTARAESPYPPTNMTVAGTLWNAGSVDLDNIPTSVTETFWTDLNTPSTLDNNWGDSPAKREVGQGFKVTVGGYIHGLRFYKGSVNNSGTHVGSLWNNSGTLLAQVTFGTETGIGWQTAYFSAPVAVTTATRYVISYYVPNDHSATDSSVSYPTTHGHIQFVDGNRVTGSGAPGYPGGTTTSSAYWVDPIFSTSPSLLDLPQVILGYTRRDFRNGDEVKAITNEASLASDFPVANTTQYRAKIYNAPTGADTLIYTTDWNAGTNTLSIPLRKVLRGNSGNIPSTLGAIIETQHLNGGTTYPSIQNLSWNYSTASAKLSGKHNWGVVAYNTGTNTVTAGSTATFTLQIGTAFSGAAVQASKNGGAYADVITAGNTSGTLSVTSGDTIAIKHLKNTSTGVETLCELFDGTGALVAYAVLTY